MLHFVINYLEHQGKAKLKGTHLMESTRVSKGWGEFIPNNREKDRHFDNSLSVYLFLEFEPKLSKSEKFNNQGMKENKTFRIPFITKKWLKTRLYIEFSWNLNAKYTEVSSIVTHPFLMFHLFQKCLKPQFRRNNSIFLMRIANSSV